MANEQARKFLNDTSMENLEKSIGTRMVINKQKKIGSVIEIIYEYWDQISANNESINAKKAEIESLKKTNLVKKLLNIGKIKKQIETLKEQISALELKNSEIKTVVSRYESELESLNKELSDFGEELKKSGLTIDDIIKEYEIIVKEIAEGKNRKPELSKEPKFLKDVKPAQFSRKSPLDRFNDRMRKYQEMQAKKNEFTEQEKQ